MPWRKASAREAALVDVHHGEFALYLGRVQVSQASAATYFYCRNHEQLHFSIGYKASCHAH